jgi:hypothetical protein
VQRFVSVFGVEHVTFWVPGLHEELRDFFQLFERNLAEGSNVAQHAHLVPYRVVIGLRRL